MGEIPLYNGNAWGPGSAAADPLGCFGDLSVPKCPRAMERDESKPRIGTAEVGPHEAAMRRDGPAARVEKCVFSSKLKFF